MNFDFKHAITMEGFSVFGITLCFCFESHKDVEIKEFSFYLLETWYNLSA